ncbi:MAG: NAD-dependent epimerase/dehydratase family protein [Candidatus Rokubacteria bacterium]|nr:NAD-dependent epimerase/dehydratase family protein [Candidatus Rokubacteria bacterium]
MRVVVTGVAGFIGSHLATRLLKEGHEVIGLDNLSAGLLEQVQPGAEFHEVDIRSREIYPLFHGADAVFHLAAKNCLADCLQDPVETAEINVVGTANVLEAAHRAGASKVVYADTSAEYEGILDFPSRVDRVAPLSVYGRSKRAGAMFCEAYQAFHGLRLTVLRYFNVYGPAQDWRRAIPPLMSAFAMRLLRGERPVIYGTGEKRRDFVYIDDVTTINVLALVDSRSDGRVLNVGSGTNYSVNEVFAAVEAQLGTGLTAIYQNDLPGEAGVTLANIEGARALGWEPRVALTEGVARSIAYIREAVIGEGRGVGRR